MKFLNPDPSLGKNITLRFPIVGIGASAGGLEAVSRLLSHLRDDTGMAFVVVQHLDPNRESLLTQILQKATPMSVTQAKNGVRIEPNCVYVIPPNRHMCVLAGQLMLLPRPKGVQVLAVNSFLTSLAEERGNKAIAVILSGTASDGALGVRAIKSEGGIVFAQDENTAMHYGMPQSAVATGAVDFVLPPEKIAAELVHIALHPVIGPDIADLFEDSKSYRRICQMLQHSTGVNFALYKPSTVKRRLLRRLMVHKLDSLEKYVKFVEKNQDEARVLHDDLLIHVTQFFREPMALKVLRDKAFPRILKGVASDAPIRVWVPGCSTGEEAYTIAMLLLDFLKRRHEPASDFRYRHQRLRLIGPEWAAIRRRSRNTSRRACCVGSLPLRTATRWSSACETPASSPNRSDQRSAFANVDLISCCNVLIYLGPTAQNRCCRYPLRPAGVGSVMPGNAENIGNFGELFHGGREGASVL